MNRRVVAMWFCVFMSVVSSVVGSITENQDAHTRAAIFIVGAVILNNVGEKK